MAQQNGDSNPPAVNPQAEFSQAWKDLVEGERQASMLENNLTSLEKKLDLLLEQSKDIEAKIEQDRQQSAGDAKAETQQSNA